MENCSPVWLRLWRNAAASAMDGYRQKEGGTAMNDSYDTLIMGSFHAERMGRYLRIHTLHPDKRPYGGHHFRTQYEARKGMAGTILAH